MKRLSLSLKILTSYSLLIILFASSILLWTFNLFEENRLSNIQKELHDQATLITEIIKAHVFSDKLGHLVKELHQKVESRITIIDQNGLVLADSEKDPLVMDNHLNRPEIQQALKEKTGFGIRYSNTIQKDMYYFAIFFESEHGKGVFTRVSLWLKDINEFNHNFLYSLAQSMLWVIIIAIIIAVLLAKSILGPIDHLVQFARRLPKEKFKTRSNINRQDEIGDLAASFNLMANEIEHLFSKIDAEKQELDGIIDSLNEGLIVVDYDLNIRLVNQSFKEIFGRNIRVKQAISAFVESEDLITRFERARYKDQAFINEFEHKGKYYYISYKALPIKQNVICIFHDITEQKSLEIQKKDFVSNVSHELRTPLTSIKGFVETLMDEEDDVDKQHYLEIIHRNSERLIHMISDLLSLSSLESSRSKLNREKVDLLKLIDQVIVIFKDKLEQKKLSLNFYHEDKQVEAELDAYRIEQVLVNLIDNAIKYSDQGGIEIRSWKNSSHVFFSVKDSGIGISDEDQARIFERFFVVNKSRSRQFGGTGLGLSLVKHIVQLHSGEIDLKSDLTTGTEFIVSLPRKKKN